MGMRIIAVDGDEFKRKLCVEKLRAEHYINFIQDKDIVSTIMKITTYGEHGSIVFATMKAAYGWA